MAHVPKLLLALTCALALVVAVLSAPSAEDADAVGLLDADVGVLLTDDGSGDEEGVKEVLAGDGGRGQASGSGVSPNAEIARLEDAVGDAEEALTREEVGAVIYTGEGAQDGGEGVDVSGDAKSEGGSDEGDLIAVDVDCSNVPDFPIELFAEHPDKEKVYAFPAKMPEGIFSRIGFNRFVSVFGIHIVGSSGVSDETLVQAAHVFAGIVDNDGDGVPDRYGAIESVRKYNTVIGYVEDPDDSDHLWKVMYVKEENQGFREQFACNMHFFEQWASDATPEFYSAMKDRLPDECTQLDEVEFDWRLWYFPFTVTYYGFLEDFSPDVLEKINTAMGNARKQEVFFGNYPDDEEMEVADFFVWSMLTKLGALECHCKSDIIETVWKVCTAEVLQELDPEWYEVLGSLEGIPKVLPTATYTGKAIVAKPGEEQSSTEDEKEDEPEDEPEDEKEDEKVDEEEDEKKDEKDGEKEEEVIDSIGAAAAGDPIAAVS
eukprot:GHVS01089127.1.p1 GENE.GHVS01089127.1~~GHVS01089127.1.p1  ORF type:complete len:489 (+),score=123.29 GHVS01089127.1:479-1945(+)